MNMTQMKLVNSATKFRHGMDKFYQPNSGLRSSRSLDEAIYTYGIYTYGTYTYGTYIYMYIYIYIYINKSTAGELLISSEEPEALCLQRPSSCKVLKMPRES
jgi:hypothetical protein